MSDTFCYVVWVVFEILLHSVGSISREYLRFISVDRSANELSFIDRGCFHITAE
jgi:hypothetical protein